MAEYIVEMKHITKRFPGVVANDDVTIQVKKGEIYALLGENGAGKSTLMSMLFGMYEPDEGEIFIRGEKVNISSPNHAAKLNIGMVHQHFKLVQNYTIAENIVMGMEPVKKLLGVIPYVDNKTAESQIAELSRRYKLDVNPEDMVEDVGVSVQQRAEILKMLYRESEILIFDEPTAVLTPQEIESLLDIIRSLREDGKTILLISHKLEEIKQVADRCAILNQGRLIAVRDVADTSTKEMANLMVGREVILNLEKKAPKYKDVALEVKNLTVHNADKFSVVKNVSFSIRGGEIFAIAGVSGNGQTEIADAIAGMLPVKEGTITLNGKDITDYNIRKRMLDGISYIPEDRHNCGLVLDFTLAENIALRSYFKEPLSKQGILQNKKIDQYGKEIIEAYDIRSGRGTKTKVRSMSGGNQQKAIIGREIELQNPLMIFVQPTRGLDIGAIENIQKQILQERDLGKAVLLVSLELDEIMELADTIGVVYGGQMLKIADARALSANEVGEFMMGVKTHEKSEI